MFLLAGLGNPGKKYEKNRHNVGFLLLDYLKEKYLIDEYQKKNKYLYLKCRLHQNEVLLIKPQSFMNLRGMGIQSALAFFKIPISNLIVIFDDIALPLGMIRIRERGSAGGHNGLKNIAQQLGTEDYQRLRIGIG